MLMRYEPFRETLSLRRAMDQLFEGSFVNPNVVPGSFSQTVPMDVCETTHGYEVDIALPGARPEDIELLVDQNTLTIRGHYGIQDDHKNQPQSQIQQSSQQQSSSQTHQHNGGQQQSQQDREGRHSQGHNWLVQEIVSGSFERSITFPKPIDPNAIQTTFQNGILTVMIPVSEASRPKRISITDQGQSKKQTIAAGKS
jgi:HSP20 family protein